MLLNCKLTGAQATAMGEITTLTPGFREIDLAVPMIEKFLDKHF